MPGRDRESIQRELQIRYRNLDTLEERQAKFGISAPLELVNQIHDEREAIASLEKLLQEAEVAPMETTGTGLLAGGQRRHEASIQTMEDRDWDSLLRRIKEGNCTPFIGPEVSQRHLPETQAIAREWAQAHGYPLDDPWNLPRVAQFLAIKRDPIFPAEELARRLQAVEARPNFREAGEPHTFLAGLPLPIYVTTNYDDFMAQALQYRLRPAHREICRWNSYLRDQPSVFDPGAGVEIGPANPLVYHLFGHVQLPESLVLTEDDYLDFLVNVSRHPEIIPRRIEKTLVNSSLLFIGYDLSSLQFRVLFRGLVASLERSLRRTRVAVQVAPETPRLAGITADHVRWYLEDYFAKDDVRIYWGSAADFVRELKERWEALDDRSQ